MRSLSWHYDTYVKEVTEANYATGKVEKLYNGYMSPEDLMRKYPKEAEALIKYYGPEFEEFYYARDSVSICADREMPNVNFRFQNILAYREFIERNHIFGRCV